MRGFVDTRAADVLAGDTLIDPNSGVLCKVESVQAEGKMVALHMRGSVSLSYMGLSCDPERVLRIAPRSDLTPGIGPVHVSVTFVSEKVAGVPIPRRSATAVARLGMCECGKRLARECADECVR